MHGWSFGSPELPVGWHCSWCFSPEGVRVKLLSAHASDTPRYVSSLSLTPTYYRPEWPKCTQSATYGEPLRIAARGPCNSPESLTYHHLHPFDNPPEVQFLNPLHFCVSLIRRFISKCQLKNSSGITFCQNTKAI